VIALSKLTWKPGTMLYPVPAVLVSCSYDGVDNIITIAWAGTVCTNPPMVSISIRPERYSYDIIKKSGEFVMNIPNKNLAYATDFCGVKSGRDLDKFEILNLTKEKASVVGAPLIKECPLSLECKVKDVIKLGSHDMFVAEVVAVNVDETLLDDTGKLHLDKAELICYNHGQYCVVGKSLGKFGFSVEKKKNKNKRRSK
jgi:flavin reductase (DIM6/NTAB) family NADH-FMN oxidoreductase RutF